MDNFISTHRKERVHSYREEIKESRCPHCYYDLEPPDDFVITRGDVILAVCSFLLQCPRCGKQAWVNHIINTEGVFR